MAGGLPRRRQARDDVPEVVVTRLPLYIRSLNRLLQEGTEVTSSKLLGEMLQMTPAQIRKDLSYFGRFGKQGQGYSVRNLVDRLREIVGLNTQWDVAVVGVGRLGRAILSYPGFTPDGFHLTAAFDANPGTVGRQVGGLTVHPMDKLEEVLRDKTVNIAIVAVPAVHTQGVIDRLVECGVRAILNYAPTSPQVQDGIKVRNIDPLLSLQSMTYYLTDAANR